MVSLEYLAGFFDADGYVGVVKNNSQNWYNLRCTLTNVDKLTLQKIQSDDGGTIQYNHFKNSNHRNQFVLSWSGKNALSLIKILNP